MGLFFYNVFLMLYAVGVRITALFNPKARMWLKGRENLLPRLQQWRETTGAAEKIVWMHCASLGEFEQGRPVLEKIRETYPAYKILVTFFSPSGFEIRKNYPGADGVFYLPADSRTNASLFIDIVKPDLVIWVKYEYWYYYLTTLQQRRIPVVLISAIIREGQPFFKFYGGIWKKMLRAFRKIFVQDENSRLLLEQGVPGAAAVAVGDTRFDRVFAIAQLNESMPQPIIDFCTGQQTLVAGSTWEEDEEEIVHYAKMHPQVKFIIAPHEIDPERLREVKKLFANAVYYSELVPGTTQAQVLIIDNIGMLSRLYAVADVAYIGGGFNDSGIHNILEAAVYGKPVIFGPQYKKFNEATDLVERGGAFCITNALQLEALLDKLLTHEQLLKEAGAVCKNYIEEKKGATEKLMVYFQENRLLTN